MRVEGLSRTPFERKGPPSILEHPFESILRSSGFGGAEVEGLRGSRFGLIGFKGFRV